MFPSLSCDEKRDRAYNMTQLENFKKPSKAELLHEIDNYVDSIKKSLADVNTKVSFLSFAG